MFIHSLQYDNCGHMKLYCITFLCEINLMCYKYKVCNLFFLVEQLSIFYMIHGQIDQNFFSIVAALRSDNCFFLFFIQSYTALLCV